MENALKEWGLVFDDASYNIWHNSPPKLALIQVMFHNLMKQLQILQQTFSSERVLTDNSPKQSEHTPKKFNRTVEIKPKENMDISDVDSPDVFKDVSVLSPNMSDSVFNRNVMESTSPAPEQEIVVPALLFSPTINRRKFNKKKKVDYPELNTTDKTMFQDSISTSPSESSLIDFAKNIETKIRVNSYSEKCVQNASNNSELKSNETNEVQNLSRIQKRIHNLKSVSLKPTIIKKVQFKADKDVTVSENANKCSDATILLSCPVASALDESSFLEMPKERTTKPIFLSKWEQRKLQEEDVDEQNCSRCGNFRGFQDLSPTMCGTKDYKCPKHRKKYMRLNTPDAIWNLDFPDDSE